MVMDVEALKKYQQWCSGCWHSKLVALIDLIAQTHQIRTVTPPGDRTLVPMFEALRFDLTTMICQQCPPGPERDARLAMLEELIKNAWPAAPCPPRPGSAETR